MKKVIIYGNVSHDWMSALAPEAPVWSHLPQVESVVHLKEGEKHYDLSNDCENVVLIPLFERHLYVMPTEFKSLTSSAELVRMFANKRHFAKAIQEKGFAEYIPKNWLGEEAPEFPCLIKRENLNAGEGIYWVENFNELNRIKLDPIFSGQSYFFEEHIPGEEEFVAHIVAKNGDILLIHTFCYFMENENSIRVPGNPQKIVSVELAPHLQAIFGSVIKAFDYSGPGCINFKIYNGVPKIFEINPRMGGSLMMSHNVPYLIDVLEAIIENAS
jgi:carbamoylphosphate synthase large subunit